MKIKENSVYLSGAISGRDWKVAKGHFKAFEYCLEDEITRDPSPNQEKMGFRIVNPTDLDEQESWVDYMKIHIPAMIGCEAVVMLTGWETSRGAALERMIAHELKMPIYYEEELTWD
tara:strand:+ start:256 stop:606 length:351 start_codon:yes stop_codon:yes gene_type:complete